MDSTSRMLRTVLRGLALLVTLSIGAYLVVSAQGRASRAEASPEPAAESVAAPPVSETDEEGTFLSSSKSLAPDAVYVSSSTNSHPGLSVVDLGGFGQAESETVYLSGSKSGAVPSLQDLSGASDADIKKADAAPANDAKKP